MSPPPTPRPALTIPTASPVTTLAIECASEACSVALFAGRELVAGEQRILGRGHAEALIPMIAALPGKGRAARIVVGLGPGSFTGARIGLAAARALALAWEVPALGYPTLALIAAMARQQRPGSNGEPQPVLVATTAGHGEWFTQGFDATGNATTPLASLSPNAAAALHAALGQISGHGPLVAGSQAEALIAAAGPAATAPALALWPDARCVSLLDESVFTPALAPLYGRAPDARLPANPAPTSPA